MTVASVGQALTERVAEEILALLGRRRMSQAQLARRLGQKPMWMSDRLRGAQQIGLNDLQRIAVALGVEVHDLIPRTTPERSINERFAVSERPTTERPTHNHPRVIRHPNSPRPKSRPTAAIARPPAPTLSPTQRRPGPVRPPKTRTAVA